MLFVDTSRSRSRLIATGASAVAKNIPGSSPILAILAEESAGGNAKSPTCLAFSRCGGRFALGYEDGRVVIGILPPQNRTTTISLAEGGGGGLITGGGGGAPRGMSLASLSISAMCFGGGYGEPLIIGTESGDISIALHTGSVSVVRPKRHRSEILCIAAHPNSKDCLTVSYDLAILWQISPWKQKAALPQLQNNNSSLATEVGFAVAAAFDPKGEVLATMHRKGGIAIWKYPSLDFICHIGPISTSIESPLSSFCFAPSGDYLVGLQETSYLVWNFPNMELIGEGTLPSGAPPISVCPCAAAAGATGKGGKDGVLILGADGATRGLNAATGELFEKELSLETIAVAAPSSVTAKALAIFAHPNGSVSLVDLQKAFIGGENSSSGSGSETSSKKKRRETPSALPPGALVTTSSSSSSSKNADKQKKKSTSRPQSAPPTATTTNYANNNLAVHNNGGIASLNRDDLGAYLSEHGSFPAKYRAMVWRKILQLPNNAAGFERLVAKGIHPQFWNLLKTYPVGGEIGKRFERIVSALAHWSEVLAFSPFLPQLVYPFVVFYQRDELACFETIATILTNWGRDWFSLHPAPPLPVLEIARVVVERFDKQLETHLKKVVGSAANYIWPLLRSFFSECVDEASWYPLMDFILLTPPDIVPLIAAAVIRDRRAPLLRCFSKREVDENLRRGGAVYAKGLIGVARSMFRQSETWPTVQALASYQMQPLQVAKNGDYPPLASFPFAAVQLQKEIYEDIKREEEQLLRHRELMTRMNELAATEVAETALANARRKALDEAEETLRAAVAARVAEKRALKDNISKSLAQMHIQSANQMLEAAKDWEKMDEYLKEKELARLRSSLSETKAETIQAVQSIQEKEKALSLEMKTALKIQMMRQERVREKQLAALRAEIAMLTKKKELQKENQEIEVESGDAARRMRTFSLAALAAETAMDEEEQILRKQVADAIMEEEMLEKRAETRAAMERQKNEMEEIQFEVLLKERERLKRLQQRQSQGRSLDEEEEDPQPVSTAFFVGGDEEEYAHDNGRGGVSGRIRGAPLEGQRRFGATTTAAPPSAISLRDAATAGKNERHNDGEEEEEEERVQRRGQETVVGQLNPRLGVRSSFDKNNDFFFFAPRPSAAPFDERKSTAAPRDGDEEEERRREVQHLLQRDNNNEEGEEEEDEESAEISPSKSQRTRWQRPSEESPSARARLVLAAAAAHDQRRRPEFSSDDEELSRMGRVDLATTMRTEDSLTETDNESRSDVERTTLLTSYPLSSLPGYNGSNNNSNNNGKSWQDRLNEFAVTNPLPPWIDTVPASRTLQETTRTTESVDDFDDTSVEMSRNLPRRQYKQYPLHSGPLNHLPPHATSIDIRPPSYRV